MWRLYLEVAGWTLEEVADWDQTFQAEVHEEAYLQHLKYRTPYLYTAMAWTITRHSYPHHFIASHCHLHIAVLFQSFSMTRAKYQVWKDKSRIHTGVKCCIAYIILTGMLPRRRLIWRHLWPLSWLWRAVSRGRYIRHHWSLLLLRCLLTDSRGVGHLSCCRGFVWSRPCRGIIWW